jgi:hypothetical protein
MLGTDLKNALSHLSFDPEIQDGGIIQKVAQKRKKDLFLLLNGQFFTDFKKRFLHFVCPFSVHTKQLILMI